jgi:hypothetical protein
VAQGVGPEFKTQFCKKKKDLKLTGENEKHVYRVSEINRFLFISKGTVGTL